MKFFIICNIEYECLPLQLKYSSYLKVKNEAYLYLIFHKIELKNSYAWFQCPRYPFQLVTFVIIHSHSILHLNKLTMHFFFLRNQGKIIRYTKIKKYKKKKEKYSATILGREGISLDREIWQNEILSTETLCISIKSPPFDWERCISIVIYLFQSRFLWILTDIFRPKFLVSS